MIWVMGIAGCAMLGLGLTVAKPLLFAVPLLILCGWLFSSLTIDITDLELRWRFGPGIIRKRVALEEIVAAEAVKTNSLEGWGIHLSRFGWLYNVSGYDAVAVTLRNGKRFALGTDEPQALVSKLQEIILRQPAAR